MCTTIIPIEPIEAAIREEMDQLCGSKGWLAPIDSLIPRKMYGLAHIAVAYYTGGELRIIGGKAGTGNVFVHADAYDESNVKPYPVDFDALRALAA